MKIIILGAGGLGRQVLAQLQVDYGHGIDWVIGGFLDERGPEAVAESLYYPWLGYPESFVAEPDQLFVAAVGDPLSRQKQVACLLAKGAEFVAIRTRCTNTLNDRIDGGWIDCARPERAAAAPIGASSVKRMMPPSLVTRSTGSPRSLR